MLILMTAELLLIREHAVGIGLHAATQLVQLLLAGAGVIVDLFEVFANLFAGTGQALERGAHAQLDVRHLMQKVADFAADRFELALELRLLGEALFVLGPGLSAFVAELLAELADVPAGFLQFFERGGGRLLLSLNACLTLIQRRRLRLDLLVPRVELLVRLALLLFKLSSASVEIGGLSLDLLELLGESALPHGELVAALAQLLLQRLADAFGLGHRLSAFAQRLTLGVDSGLRFLHLSEPAGQHRLLFIQLDSPRVDVRLADFDRSLAGGKMLLGQTHLVHRGLERSAALRVLFPLARPRLILTRQLLALAIQLGGPNL